LRIGIDYTLSHDQPRPIYHADRCLHQRYVQSDIVFHCRSPSLGGHIRLAPYVPGELIPLSLSGSIPELLHVAKVENRTTAKISRKSIFGLLCCCVAFSATTEVRGRFW